MLKGRVHQNKLIIFLRKENGQGLAEYGPLLLLISVASILMMTSLGERILALFNVIADAVLSAIA